MTTKSKQAGSDAGTTTPEAPKQEKTPVRFVERGGIQYPVVRTYFSKRRGCLVDVIQKVKTVEDRRGNFKDITVSKRFPCRDPEVLEAFEAKRRALLEEDFTV